MNSASPLIADRPAYVDNAPKLMLINGDWVPAGSGALIDSINPSNGEVIAQFAAGEASDVDLAVAAARRAFEGPWSKFTPVQRQNILLEFADLVLAHADDLPLLDTYD